MSRYLGFAIFISIAVGILTGLHYLFYVRLIRDIGLPREWRIGLTVLLIVAGMSLPLAMIVGRLLSAPWRAVVVWPAFLWMGCVFLLAVLLLFGDVTRGVATLAGRWLQAVDVSDPSRRLFFSRVLGATVALGTLGLSSVAVASAIAAPRVRRVRVALKRLPRLLDGFVIAQLTDLHVGETVSRSFVEEVVRRTNALKPDLIVITGDLVDGGVAELANDVAPIAQLKARFGVYFVTGNHEYYSGVTPWLEHLRGMGIKVLRNERVSIGEGDQSFDLAGVDDSGTGHALMEAGHGADVPRAMAGAEPTREVVLLAHQPKEIKLAAEHDVGLVLSGHTHGGQIWPFGFLVALTQPYLEGLHLHGGKTWIYVSKGTGYWGPPMRLATPSEITRLELHSSGDSAVDVEADAA
jgi:uncharacterized protein